MIFLNFLITGQNCFYIVVSLNNSDIYSFSNSSGTVLLSILHEKRRNDGPHSLPHIVGPHGLVMTNEFTEPEKPMNIHYPLLN